MLSAMHVNKFRWLIALLALAFVQLMPRPSARIRSLSVPALSCPQKDLPDVIRAELGTSLPKSSPESAGSLLIVPGG
ncbi:MAG: hypothetical protein MZV63_49995 [Marinilabiliales bacterium]|nr:hypothetical protein [Marinilabiliales bacterium]